MRLLDLLRGKEAERLKPLQVLAFAQQESPPPGGGGPDLGRRIYERVRPRLRGDIRDLFESGRGAIGEIGLGSPNALAEFAPPDGYVVRVYSGLSHLFHHTARVLMTAGTVHLKADEATQQPSRSQEEATEVIARVIRALKSGDDLASPGDEGLSPEKLEWATRLANAAEDFVVCHECGHIAAWTWRGGDPGSVPPEEEYLADFLALVSVLGFTMSPGAQRSVPRRIAYAGAEFALRIFASLEHLDYEFETTHPLPGGRLLKLRDAARKITGGRRDFLDICTVAFAFDQQLEAIEQRIAGETKAARFVVGLTPDRLLSTLSALIDEGIAGRFSASMVTATATAHFTAVPPEIAREAARQAVQIYLIDPPSPADFRKIPRRRIENDAFRTLLQSLPEPPRSYFTAHLPPGEALDRAGR